MWRKEPQLTKHQRLVKLRTEFDALDSDITSDYRLADDAKRYARGSLQLWYYRELNRIIG